MIITTIRSPPWIWLYNIVGIDTPCLCIIDSKVLQRVYIHIHTHIYIHTYTHTHIHTYTRMHIHTYLYMAELLHIEHIREICCRNWHCIIMCVRMCVCIYVVCMTDVLQAYYSGPIETIWQFGGKRKEKKQASKTSVCS